MRMIHSLSVVVLVEHMIVQAIVLGVACFHTFLDTYLQNLSYSTGL